MIDRCATAKALHTTLSQVGNDRGALVGLVGMAGLPAAKVSFLKRRGFI
jgi:hypothetical protein